MKKHSQLLLSCLLAVFLLAPILLGGCTIGSKNPDPPTVSLEMQPFRELMQNASCADSTNRLYVIDDRLIFWTKTGLCDDGSYAHVLFDTTPDQELCSVKDSFVGPLTNCQPEFEVMFATILANLNQPDLGLGAEHQVVFLEQLSP